MKAELEPGTSALLNPKQNLPEIISYQIYLIYALNKQLNSNPFLSSLFFSKG